MLFYQTDWKPPRTKPEWERCSMTLDSAKALYGRYLEMKVAEPTEAVAWFDPVSGACRQIVFAFDDGRHMLIQHQARGNKITFPRIT